MRRALWLAVVVMACGGARVTSGPEPPAAPTAPPAWALAVTDTTYTKTVSLGSTIDISVTITNSGSGASPHTKFQIGGMGDYADLMGCLPKCETNELFGDTYATMPGVAAASEFTYQVQYLAKALGVADMSICIYDDDPNGEQVDCLSGSVAIGN